MRRTCSLYALCIEAAAAIGFAPERRASPEVARAYAAVTPKDAGVVDTPITRALTMPGKFDGEFGNGVATWAGTGKISWIW